MGTNLTPAEVAGFFEDGFVILRDALPTALVADLRGECEKGGAAVRKKSGGQSQRFQPLSDYANVMDLRPFRDYAELPSLHESFRRILGPDVFYGKPEVAGVFLEPTDLPWSAVWHRDIDRRSSRLSSDEEFAAFALDWDSLNQINCALYDDSCTWYVPGSHLRLHDTPAELAFHRGPDAEIVKRLEKEKDAVGLERLYLDHVRKMPGATQVHLYAGDLLLYRAYGWHCGNYVPYRKRATILDVLYSPAYYAWRHPWLEGKSPKWKPSA
jgi:hypothetical protein